MDKKLKIIFMGTPDFAAQALKAIHENSVHEVIALYSQPPRPKGRGQKLQLSATHAYAEAQDIPVYTPKSLKKPEEQETFAALKADIAIVAAYGLLLPKEVLKAPKYGCLNIHASLLPRWRGASPIQRAIWAGDKKTGITIMQMDEGLDTGPIVSMRDFEITPEMDCAQLHDQLAHIGAELCIDTLDKLASEGPLSSEPQDHTQSCYAPLLKKEDGRIDWSQNAEEIDRQVRALNPWPGTFCGDFKIKAVKRSEETHTLQPGTLIDKNGLVACGAGSVLKISSLQPSGKKAMDVVSAINGGYITVGEVLS